MACGGSGRLSWCAWLFLARWRDTCYRRRGWLETVRLTERQRFCLPLPFCLKGVK